MQNLIEAAHPCWTKLCVCCSQLLGAVTRVLPVYLARCRPKFGLSAEHTMRNTLSSVSCSFSLVAALLTTLESPCHCQGNPPSLTVPYSQYLNVSNVPAAVRNASGYYGLGRHRRCFCKHRRIFIEPRLKLLQVLHRTWDRSKPVDVVECNF